MTMKLWDSHNLSRYNLPPSYAQQTRVETQSNDTATSPRDSTETTTEVLPRRLMTSINQCLTDTKEVLQDEWNSLTLKIGIVQNENIEH